jgi:hypothetical protein
MADGLDSLEEELKRTKLRELGPEMRNVRVLVETQTVETALARLAEWKVAAAPCHDSNGRFLGFVSVANILTTFLAEVASEDSPENAMLQRMRCLEEKGETFGQTPLRRCLEESSIAFVADESTSVHEALISAFVSLQQHRVPVILSSSSTPRQSSKGLLVSPESVPAGFMPSSCTAEILTIVNASDVAAFIDNKCSQGLLESHSASLDTATLVSLGFGHRSAASVAPRTPTIDVLRRLEAERSRGIAVCDDYEGETQGMLIANLSLADFGNMHLSHLGSLALPVGEFMGNLHNVPYSDLFPTPKSHRSLTVSRRTGEDGRSRTATGQLLAVKNPEDTFTSALSSLVSDKVHRLYICQKDSLVPVDVFTLFDCLSTVVNWLPSGHLQDCTVSTCTQRS